MRVRFGEHGDEDDKRTDDDVMSQRLHSRKERDRHLDGHQELFSFPCSGFFFFYFSFLVRIFANIYQIPNAGHF